MLKKDFDGNIIPTGSGFKTELITLGSSDFQQVPVPVEAVEVMSNVDGLVFGENGSAEGFPVPEFMPVGVAQMDYIFIKGNSGQEVKLFWILG